MTAVTDDLNWDALWAKPTPPAPPPVTNGHSNGSGYALTALAREADNVAAATEGTRNDTLNRAAFNLAQLVASGHLDATTVRDQLTAAALHAGLDAREIDATLKSGHRAGSQHPRAVPELAPQVVELGAIQVPTAEAEGEAPSERTSWWPEPLVERAARAAAEAPPAYLVRDDGHALLYAGMVNGLIGESESGKSWIALLAAVQATAAGQRVLILDFEDSPNSADVRLRALGCTEQQRRLVHYANPAESLGIVQKQDLEESLKNQYAVIVVDGVNAAMALFHYDLNSNTDATLFTTLFLRPLAHTGACVITIDHVPKNPETRGKGGIGAQAKRSMLDGTCLLVEIVSPFGKGQSGVVKLTVDKDRHGAARGISSGGKFAGRAHIESVSDQVHIHIKAPDLRPSDERDQWRPTGLMEKVSEAIIHLGGAPTFRALKDAVTGRETTIKEAVSALITEGYVKVETGPNRSIQHRLIKHYEQAADPKSDRFDGRSSGTAATSSVSPVSPAVSTVKSLESGANGPSDPEIPGVSVSPGVSRVSPGDTGVSVSVSPPPYRGETPETHPTDLGVPDGQSDCNRCGQATPDDIIEETAGYCRPCGRVMNP